MAGSASGMRLAGRQPAYTRTCLGPAVGYACSGDVTAEGKEADSDEWINGDGKNQWIGCREESKLSWTLLLNKAKRSRGGGTT